MGHTMIDVLYIQNELANLPPENKDAAVRFVLSKTCRFREVRKPCVWCKWSDYAGLRDYYEPGINTPVFIAEAKQRFKPV